MRCRIGGASSGGLRRAAVTLLLLGAATGAAAQVGSPAGPVPPERLAARRAALLDRVGAGVVVVRSAEEKSLEGDYPQASDYRENNDFFYLTGLEAPHAVLVLLSRGGAPAGDRAILYLPSREPAQEEWTGAALGPGPETARLAGIGDVRSLDRYEAEVTALLADSASPARWGIVMGGVVPTACRGELAAGACGDELLAPWLRDTTIERRPLGPYTAALRLVKDAEELRRMRRAVAITVDAQDAAMRAAVPGMWEYELEALIEYTFRREGAERVGFPSIVGSGPNSTVLHYDKNRRRMLAGDLAVLDIGAEFGYFSADVTRTIPVSGHFTPRQRAIYELVLKTQQAAIDSVRPGRTLLELDAIAREYMRRHSGSLCGADACDRYFIHALSHWLGMDVHDVGAYQAKLAPGMVLTVEPGIYLPREALGVRIEDDVLVTDDGHEVLSAGAPRTAAEVESAMAAGRARAAGQQ